MGLISSQIKQLVEKKAFFPPKPGYKTSDHRLFFLGNNEASKIACMKYNENAPGPVILYSHGNATDIGRISDYLEMLANDMDLCIVSYDYPGYGFSPGIASEKGCVYAINVVYEHLISIGYMTKNIILYGSSIGTGPTAKLGSMISGFRGILLQTPFTSGVGVVSDCGEQLSYSCSYVSESPNIFTTEEIIHKIDSPITIIHGTNDEIIAYSHVTKLFEKIKDLNENNKLVTLPGAGHNNIENMFYTAITDSLLEFIFI